MRTISLVLAGALALALAGCSEEKPAEAPAATEQTTPPPAEAPKAAEAPAPAADTTAAPASDQGCPVDVSEADRANYPACAEEAAEPAAASDVSEAAVNACLAAVTKETNVSDVALLSTEFSEANSIVMVGVGPDRAAWKCLVSSDGVVSEVSSTVGEGAL